MTVSRSSVLMSQRERLAVSVPVTVIGLSDASLNISNGGSPGLEAL